MVRGAYPYGIVLMGRAYHTWLYDGDPLTDLNFPRTILEIRRKWEADPTLFQGVVRRWFLDNPHRLLSVMEPSRTMQEEREEEIRADGPPQAAPPEAEELIAGRHSARAFQTEPPRSGRGLAVGNRRHLPRDRYHPTERTAIGGVPA
jgi:Zn-dependent M16 (insulinase) family peptidase